MSSFIFDFLFYFRFSCFYFSKLIRLNRILTKSVTSGVSSILSLIICYSIIFFSFSNLSNQSYLAFSCVSLLLAVMTLNFSLIRILSRSSSSRLILIISSLTSSSSFYLISSSISYYSFYALKLNLIYSSSFCACSRFL